jgi:hypothetical protein
LFLLCRCTDIPTFQQFPNLFKGQLPQNQSIEWIDSAIFIPRFLDAGNTYVMTEFVLGPVITILKMFKEKLITKEYQTSPHVILCFTRYFNGKIPWFDEILGALMSWGGLSRPFLTPAAMKERGVFANTQGGKWLCARKAIIPGHFGTPLLGESVLDLCIIF